jgi:hypothetical protein
MRSITLISVLVAIGIGSTSALARSTKQPSHPGHGAAGATGATGATGAAPHGKAYGWYCRNESKKHVPGQKGTPFSQCVTAMAKLKNGKSSSPAAACANLSKTHTPGQPGTPYSRCVSAGAKLHQDQHHP